MPTHLRRRLTILLILSLPAALTAHAAPAYKYIRIGAQQDKATQPQAGFALMGGGADLDEAFRFLCNRAHGGDFLILRATGDDDYNPYVHGLEDKGVEDNNLKDNKGCRLNSIATLILPTRASVTENEAFIAQTIRNAEAIFIAGGDQANYTRNWTSNAVQQELNAAIQRGVPIGGTSAGLAVLGEYAYSAEGDKPDDPNLDAKTALADPLGPRITLFHNFVQIPILKGIITDTHFAKRNRMGRLLAFLAQIHAKHLSEIIHGLGIEERCAILIEPNGKGHVIGRGAAYLISITQAPDHLADGHPLPAAIFTAQKVDSGQLVDLSNFQKNAPPYTLIVKAGQLSTDPPGHPIN